MTVVSMVELATLALRHWIAVADAHDAVAHADRSFAKGEVSALAKLTPFIVTDVPPVYGPFVEPGLPTNVVTGASKV